MLENLECQDAINDIKVCIFKHYNEMIYHILATASTIILQAPLD